MKKLKLLLAACALFGGVSLGWAQTDVTNTYITNADFSSTDGWTGYSGGGSEHSEGFGLIGTLNLNNKPSTTDDNHLATEYCCGFSARWNGRYTYYQQIVNNLPSGYWTVSYDVQDVNTSSTKYNIDSHFYVQVGDTKYADASTEWMNAGASGWTPHSISFNLTETSNITLSLGYGNKENKGSNDCPAVYVSHLKLTWTDPNFAAAQTKLSGYIKKATALNGVLSDEILGTAITTAEGVLGSATTSSACNDASDDLSSAITTALSGLTPVALTNGNFDTSVDMNASGTHSAESINTTNAGAYEVSGWTANFGSEWVYGATSVYNTSSAIINGVASPTSDMFSNTEGGTLHFSSGWNNQARYKQTVNNLPSGRYVFYYEANNQNSAATSIASNYFGVSGTAGDFYGTSNSFVYDETKSFDYNAWKACAFEFDVAKAADIDFHIGIVGASNGSGNGAKLWIDNVLVYRIADLMVEEADANQIIEEAEALNDAVYNATEKSELASKLSAFKGNKSLDNYNALNVALATAKSSVDVYKKLDAAIKNTETWSATTAAEGLRAKYSNGSYEDETTAADIYEEYQAAEIAALAGSSTNDWTSVILNASFETGDMTGWSAESRNDTGVKNQSNSTYSITNGVAVDGSKLFNSWGGSAENNVYQTIKNLPAGTYTLTALVAGFKDETLTVTAGEESNNVVVAGDKTVGYTVGVVFTLTTASDVLIKASNTMGAEGSDASFIKADNFKLYKGNAMTSDYTALNGALSNVSSKTLGFDKGEYAPYNNVAAVAALAAAKAVNQEREIAQPVLDAIVSNLTSATWTVNNEDLNAIYDGTFANAENNSAPAGWTMSNNTLGGDGHSRAFVGDNRLSEFNETKSAFFLRFDGINSDRGSMYYYGNTPGYTMPLKADTYYVVTADAANWGTAVNKPLRLNVEGPMYFSQELNMENDADQGDEAPQKFEIRFKATVAGNYVISFQCPGSDDNKHMVMVSNLKLEKLAESEETVTFAAEYATFIVPFDAEIPENVEAYDVTGINETTLVLEKVDAISANTPVLLCNKGAGNTYKFRGYDVYPTKAESYTNELLTGVYAETTAPVGSYVLQNLSTGLGFYKVAEGEGKQPKVGANHAYLTLPVQEQTDARALYFDNATAIRTIEALTSGEAEIYNTAGARQNGLQKGVNIIKQGNKTFKVMVK